MRDNPSLTRHIIYDLLSVGKFPLFLLVMILLSSLSIVYFTQKTRGVVDEHDKLLMERERLEVEWRNQLLEEHALSEHTRVEQIAREDLDMVRPDRKHEVIVSNE